MKTKLRQELRKKRKAVADKNTKDKLIEKRLLESKEYINSKLVLCYLSLNDEVSTDCIIKNALKCKKQVAVPYCTDKKGIMEFYLIDSLDTLKAGSYGIREPDINKCSKVYNFSSSITIVPALSFDKNGYRLGYGGGYYDRFLSQYNGTSVGICYDEMMSNRIPTDKHDKNVDIIITDKQTIYGGENG